MVSPLPRTICRARTTETVFHGLKTSLAGVAKAKRRRRRFTSEWEEAPPELGGRHNVAKERWSWRRTKCADSTHTAVELYACTSSASACATDALIVHCMRLFPLCTHRHGFSIPRLGRKADGAKTAPDISINAKIAHGRTQEFSSQRPSAPTRHA